MRYLVDYTVESHEEYAILVWEDTDDGSLNRQQLLYMTELADLLMAYSEMLRHIRGDSLGYRGGYKFIDEEGEDES